MSPFTATSIAARGLRSSSIAVSFLTVLPSAMSVFEMTMRSARIACLRASGAFSRFFSPVTASTTVSTTSMANSPPSARSVEKVCRIGLRSARPLVSISTRPKCGILPRSRSDDQPPQRVLQIGAGVAAQAAVAEQRHLVAALAQQRVVDALRAELVDDQRGAFAFRRLQEPPHQRRLAGAEKSGDDRHRQPRSALALLPPAELAGAAREEIEDGRHRPARHPPEEEGRTIRCPLRLRNPSPGSTARRCGGRRSRPPRAHRRTRR